MKGLMTAAAVALCLFPFAAASDVLPSGCVLIEPTGSFSVDTMWLEGRIRVTNLSDQTLSGIFAEATVHLEGREVPIVEGDRLSELGTIPGGLAPEESFEIVTRMFLDDRSIDLLTRHDIKSIDFLVLNAADASGAQVVTSNSNPFNWETGGQPLACE